MNPEETSSQGIDQRTSLLEYLGMGGCLIPILAVIGLVSWGTASLLNYEFRLPIWLGIPIGLVAGVLVVSIIAASGNSMLMELSITCTIIAVLGFILVPVFRQAREKARVQTCRTHLKQVGAAMRMYADDHDGRLPLRANWCDAVLPYVPSWKDQPARRVFRCPSVKNQPSGQAYNAQLNGLSTSRITTPSTTAAVFDARGGWNLAGGPDQAVRRHRNGLCLLFADGHARWLKSLDGVVWKPASTRSGR